MSLVNDMLRDLEERRAAPAERLALEGLQAVDEAAAARRERIERLHRTPLGHFQLYLKGLHGDPLIVSRRHVAGVRKLMNHL